MNTALADIQTEVVGGIGCITLNRPKALNALSLSMVRALLATLQAWRDDPALWAVAIRGSNRHAAPGSAQAAFGSFCAGGDIRFFHQAALADDASLGDFFTDEYTLNHLIHEYPKPYIAFMDGVVMGGGMGISQGASLRIVTERTQMAMPETGIGLFPDVGGGYFLSRCPGHIGEYLALTGASVDAAAAVQWGLADVQLAAHTLPALWSGLQGHASAAALQHWIDTHLRGTPALAADQSAWLDAAVEGAFGLPTVGAIVAALQAQPTQAAQLALDLLRRRSPLML
ncbi:MAG: 3-hydroxyisobutyryl-CoA hydrolase, partial [Rhodoferax sp.]